MTHCVFISNLVLLFVFAGAFSATSSASLPSFQLLTLTGHSASVYSYSLRKGKVDVLHSEHVKGGGAASAAAAAAGSG